MDLFPVSLVQLLDVWNVCLFNIKTYSGCVHVIFVVYKRFSYSTLKSLCDVVRLYLYGSEYLVHVWAVR
jgi:hypothetical protein